MLYDNQSPPTVAHKPKQTEVPYDLFEDYIGIHKGEPTDYWCWTTWYPGYAEHPLTEELPYWEDFNFHYEEMMNCNVPEPTVSSFFVLGAVVLTAIKRRLT